MQAPYGGDVIISIFFFAACYEDMIMAEGEDSVVVGGFGEIELVIAV